MPFDVIAPQVDEAANFAEDPQQLATRLADAKARAVERTNAIVIGSDQVASLDGRILRKPGTATRAVQQLRECQGRTVEFFTAATVFDRATQRRYSTVDQTTVEFRMLDKAALECNVSLDEPWNCAGGFKVESLGCVLFRRISTSDPTALIGLPMIWLASVLIECGLNPLATR
jgi:septum formation protein